MPRYSESTLSAIKNAVDIVSLAADYGLPLTRAGGKFKALCPFHDDQNPSLELNPERQSYKCWSCGAGGDVFDFVKEYERVEFPEALRMLADRAGVTLEASTSEAMAPRGPSKTELLAVNAWAEGLYQEELARSSSAREYFFGRGLTAESASRFRIGYAPGERGWLLSKAKRAGISSEILERAGLVSHPADAPGLSRERFRGRLIFPIHDPKGRAIGFGGRVLPEVERFLAASGKNVAKYLNSPETTLFQKRRVLYASDLARPAAREAGWVAVVEGYTDVIAAHQVGLGNVVGTLGTALGDDHVRALRGLADRVVLIFDGDAAGQNAADRSLEFFLGHEVDVRVLTLPDNLDPCDFLLKEGASAFRSLVDRAVDPLAFALARAGRRFDLDAIEGSRQAAEWVLNILGQVRSSQRVGLDVKVAKALDTLAQRLRLPVETLDRRLRQIRRDAQKSRRPKAPAEPSTQPHALEPVVDSTTPPPRVGDPLSTTRPVPDRPPAVVPLRATDLDPNDREIVQIVLNEPKLVGHLVNRVTPSSLGDGSLRAILQACYDLHGEGISPTFDRIALRLDDPGARALAAGLLLPIDPAPAPDYLDKPPLEIRLAGALAQRAGREHRERLREVRIARQEALEAEDHSAYQALNTEYLRLMTQRPDTKAKSAS